MDYLHTVSAKRQGEFAMSQAIWFKECYFMLVGSPNAGC